MIMTIIGALIGWSLVMLVIILFEGVGKKDLTDLTYPGVKAWWG